MKADRSRGAGMGFGGVTLILIFGILCLITFSVLALVSARSDYHLMEKAVAAVKEYYAADSQGEEFLAAVDRQLREIRAESVSESDFYEQASAAFADYYDKEKHTLSATVGMNERLHLEIVLNLTYDSADTRQFRVESYKTVQNGVVEIDTSMPVWTGEKEQ